MKKIDVFFTVIAFIMCTSWWYGIRTPSCMVSVQQNGYHAECSCFDINEVGDMYLCKVEVKEINNG